MRRMIFDRFAAAGCRWMMATAVLVAVMAGSGVMDTYAADSSVIENVSVTLTTTYGEQEEIPEPEVSVSGDSCSLGDVQYRTAYDRWKPGKKVRIEVTVNAENGKVFPVSLNHSQCKVKGGNFVSARELEEGKLQVKIDYTPVTVLGNTTNAAWSSTNSNRAVWKAVDDAPGYSVVLYGDDKVVKREKVEGATSLDLSQYIKSDGRTYFYEVKAIPITSEQKKYLKEGQFVASKEQGEIWEEWNDNTDDGGSIKGGNYIMPDGRKDTNTWKKVSNQWYYFDQNGNMVRGWRYINNNWYYMDGSGRMRTGWVNPSGGNWFYTSATGEMQTGWVQPQPGDWYYLDGNGYMQRGWVYVGGKWYYLDQSGKMQRGWVLVGGVWYYLWNDGSMATNTVIDGWTITASGAAYH